MTGQLACQPLPGGAWTQNLRRALSARAWATLSRDVRRGAACHTCGAQDTPLEAHEVWAVSAGRSALHLREIAPTCAACHAVIHIGRTAATGGLDRAAAHLGRVNGWSAARVRDHIETALRTHAQYGAGVWNVRMDDGPELHAAFATPAGALTVPLAGEILQLLSHAQRQLDHMPPGIEFVFRDVPLRPLLKAKRYAGSDIRASHLLGHSPQVGPASIPADLIVERGGLRGYLTNGHVIGELPCDLRREPN